MPHTPWLPSAPTQREHELIRRERQATQEEALAEALAQQKTAEEARLREIQQICESDPMLRELQEKIKVRVGRPGAGPVRTTA